MRAKRELSLRDLKFGHPVVLGVIIVRIIAAVYILIDPFIGYVFTIFFDTFDCYFLVQHAGYRKDAYQLLDKTLDLVGYLCQVIVSYRYPVLFSILIVLLLLRITGQVIFYLTSTTKYYIFFPNIFEVVFVWFVVLPQTGFLMFVPQQFIPIFFGTSVIVKILQEWFVHRVIPKYFATHRKYPTVLQIFGYKLTGYEHMR